MQGCERDSIRWLKLCSGASTTVEFCCSKEIVNSRPRLRFRSIVETNWSFSVGKEKSKMDVKCNGVSEGEDGYVFRSPLNANGVNRRKRVKLQGKVPENCCSINTPFVPKRLRSDSKRKQMCVSSGAQLCNGFSAGVEQNMLQCITKDEEEVAETLTFMANLIAITKPVKKEEDGKILGQNSETKATSSSPLEAPKEDGTEFKVLCNGATLNNPSSCIEEQPTATSISQKFDAEANVPSQPNSPKKLSSTEELIDGVAPLQDATKISDPLGASLRMLHPTQLDSILVPKQEKELARDVRGKDFGFLPETVPDGQPGLHSRGCEQLTTPSPTKAGTNPNYVTVSGRHCSAGLPVEELSPTSTDKKQPWKNCFIHVYIAHLIENHQETEKRLLVMLQCNQSKPDEVANHDVRMSSVSLIERSMREARNPKLQNERLVQDQKGCNLASLSVVRDAKSLVNEMKSLGDLHVPWPPNQAVMPFTVPRGSYTSQYHEKLAAGTAQQVQLQLPLYIASGQLYRQHIGGHNTTGGGGGGGAAAAAAAAATSNQQVMWQTQLAHYLQNGRQHSSSLLPRVPLHGDYNPHNLQHPFIFPMASSSPSSVPTGSKQKQIIADSFR